MRELRHYTFVVVLVALVGISSLISAVRPTHADPGGMYRVYLAGIKVAAQTTPPLNCEVGGTSYTLIPTYDSPDPRPDTEHADLNLALRGYEPTGEHLGLVDYGGPTDDSAPQLPGLFGDQRTPQFVQNYRVYGWFWDSNSRGPLLPHPAFPNEQWPVALSAMRTTRGEGIFTPNRRGGEIDQGGYKALVIFASENRITLKYTRNDDVIQGYTIHIENVCVAPSLLALYRTGDNGGRNSLPALHPGQALGRASGDNIRVSIRDNGIFMDPRSRKDWWVGRSSAWFDIAPETLGPVERVYTEPVPVPADQIE